METFGNKTKNAKKCFDCEICNFKCFAKNDWNRHIKTQKHINNSVKAYEITDVYEPNVNSNENIITQESNSNDVSVSSINGDKYVISNNYKCEICQFFCVNKSDWMRHINTKKHKTYIEQNKKEIFTCMNCQKEYYSRNGLWKHKQKCKIVNNNIKENITPELVLELIKNNNEFKNIIMEQNSTINNLVTNGIITNNNITNNNITNNNNKTFNLQVFLNETCKDAMNISDFVNSIQLQLSDFERMGEVGYAQGISDIITSNLQALDITQRPVHCTDKKRETMYVKDQDQWIKDDENKTKIKKMIKRIENKNIQIIPQFQKKYPNYANPKSHESDKYHKTIIEVMGGPGGSEGKEGKIIRNISKVTTIREKE